MLETYHFGKDILYVTDESEVYDSLRKEGCYVLPYLHESVKSEDFPGASWLVEDWNVLDRESMEQIYRRLAGLPWDILETKRCRVRETTVEDVDSFYRIYAEPAITEYMEDLFEDRDEQIAYTKDYIEKVYAFYGYGMWTVLDKESGAVIGRAGITWREGYDMPELGFVIGGLWQERGFAYEVCSAILTYAGKELQIEQVQALVQKGNEKSLRLCEKLGFERAGEVWENGALHVRLIRNLS